jgi:hypothetical protein
VVLSSIELVRNPTLFKIIYKATLIASYKHYQLKHKNVATSTQFSVTNCSVKLRCFHVNFRCIYFHLKMVVRPKNVADNLNKIVTTIEISLCR